jgi:RNA-directed DNA polymerase
MASITDYLEKKMKLKVNREKSKVSQAAESNLLGFSFFRAKEKWVITIAQKSFKWIKDKIRAATRRNDPTNAKEKIRKLETVIEGWVNYFRIAKHKSMMQVLDWMVGHRLRMEIWKQWKTPENRAKNLRKLGIREDLLHVGGKGSGRYCRIAYNFTLQKTINNKTLQRAGYVGFENHYYWKTSHQTTLF